MCVGKENIMSAITALVVGLALMLFTAGGVLLLLRGSLHQLLIELCGEEHRARFWGQLYAAMVVLTVGLAGIWFSPPASGETSAAGTLYYLLTMFRAGLMGLLLCLGILAMTMTSFIKAHDKRA